MSEHIDQNQRLEWFRNARFGMFIHWGLYAQIGRHEWVMNRERIPIPEYEQYADTWKPEPGAAREWAMLAKQSGMRYMVMTTKHHEGFSLWDSKLNEYNSVNRGPGRDLVAEYVEACRDEGLKVGLYYSLGDWHHPDGHTCKNDEAARRRFVDYTHGLVRELMTNYGKIDILWYDGQWPLTTAEEFESVKLNAMVRELQPSILINNRSDIPEDFGTPENQIIADTSGRMWEACMTFNTSWGYTPIDVDFKSTREVLSMLRQVASGGGNLLLNIGPDPSGGVPEPCVNSLLEVGLWLKEYGKSIYEATDMCQQEWMLTGAFTFKNSTMYFHCNRWPGKEFSIGGIRNKIMSVKLMNGSKIEFEQIADRLILKGLPEKAPNALVTVIEIEVEGKPLQVLGFGYKLVRNDPWLPETSAGYEV